MIALALALLQSAAPPPPVQPDQRATIPHAASPRSLSGRFTCDAHVFEVAVTTEPSLRPGASVPNAARLDRLAIDGKPIDAGSLGEARRMIARLADVVSLDVRCLGEQGELSLYGTQGAAGGAVRRARVRGTLARGRASGFVVSVEQARR